MRHLKNFFSIIEVHPLTFLYLILAWFGGYLKWYLSTLLIVCIHEICHLLMAYYFHFKINKVEILPFGAYLSLDDFYFHPILHELCVVLCGPCSHLFIAFFIQQMTTGVYQEYLYSMNTWVFMFNLIPIYPMDGHRIICLLLQYVTDLKDSFYISLKVSVFCFCVFSLLYFRVNTMVILSYLFIQQFYCYKSISIYLRKYYSQISTFSTASKIIVHKDLLYRRGYHNYYLLNDNLYDEKDIVYLLLKDVKKHKNT